MRWKLPPKKRIKITDTWFAWRPVKVGHNQWAWMERVLRTREYQSHRWIRLTAGWVDYYLIHDNIFDQYYDIKEEIVR